MSNSAQDFQRIWSRKLARLKRLQKRLPKIVGNEAVLFFDEQYKKQQTPDGKEWQARKDGDTSRSLLVKSGRLRKSIRISKVTDYSVTIGSDVSYGKYHNDGTEKMPQRKFLGNSKILIRRLKRLVAAKIIREMRK